MYSRTSLWLRSLRSCLITQITIDQIRFSVQHEWHYKHMQLKAEFIFKLLLQNSYNNLARFESFNWTVQITASSWVVSKQSVTTWTLTYIGSELTKVLWVRHRSSLLCSVPVAFSPHCFAHRTQTPDQQRTAVISCWPNLYWPAWTASYITPVPWQVSLGSLQEFLGLHQLSYSLHYCKRAQCLAKERTSMQQGYLPYYRLLCVIIGRVQRPIYFD